jgi:hypothetical protein
MACQQPQSPISSGVTATRAIRRRSSRPCCFSQTAVASGGKSLLGEQTGRFFEHAALIAFQPEEIIAAEFLRDEPGAFLLAVHRVGRDDRARGRLDFFEQRFERRNFVALFGNGQLVQGQPQLMRDGREQLQRFAIMAAAAAQHLAINGQLLQRADFLFGQPGPDGGGKAVASTRLSTR